MLTIVDNMLNYTKVSHKNIQDQKADRFYKIDFDSKKMSTQLSHKDVVEIRQTDYDKLSQELDEMEASTGQQNQNYQIRFGDSTYENHARQLDGMFALEEKSYENMTAIKSPRQSLQEVWNDQKPGQSVRGS